MACDKQPSFGSLLEQLIMAPYAMRIDLGKRVLEQVEAQVTELTRERDEALEEAKRLTGYLDTERKCNENREADIERLESEVTRLTDELKAAEQRARDLQSDLYKSTAMCVERANRVRELEAENRDIRNLNAVAARTAHAAESECAALREEVERLRGYVESFEQLTDGLEPHDMLVHWHSDRARLAAANALLGEVSGIVENPCLTVYATLERLKGALAAHPATAPARDEAEQAVLDAAVKWANQGAGRVCVELADACFALARRGLK